MRIITVSDNPNMFSGLARVHRNIIDMLIDNGHHILPIIWHGYDNDTLQKIKDKEIKPPALYYTTSSDQQVQMLTIPKGKDEQTSMKMLYEVIKTAKPDVVCTIGDYYDFYYMQSLKVKSDYSFKWLAYLTIETDEIDEKLIPVFRYADGLAVPTNYGRTILESAVAKPVEVIPYGVDSKFRKLPEDERRRLREERDCADKVRFITVAQNTWRKNLPALIQAVKLICHRDPHKRMQFYLHTNIDGDDSREMTLYDLRQIVTKLGVDDWFVFPNENTSEFLAPSDDYLIKEYNASDYFITPSICEGYGLPFLEAMACGVPVIANGASVMPEIIGPTMSDLSFGPAKRGWLVGNRVEIIPPSKMIKVPRQDALGQAIWEVVQWKDSEQIRQNCIDYAKERTWEIMKRGMSKIFEAVNHKPVSIPVEVME